MRALARYYINTCFLMKCTHTHTHTHTHTPLFQALWQHHYC
jgi:hypothetical protein